MKMLTESIYINNCSCGWLFPALSVFIKKCPQCRDEIKYCQKCSMKIKHSSSDLYCKKCLTGKDVYCPVCKKEKEEYLKLFCDYCSNIEKVIIRKNMSKRIERIKTFKESRENVCNYDCENCIHEDCIQPVDDFQPELF